MPFRTFGLSEAVVKGVLASGYSTPTEIQMRVIPEAVLGRDIIACAQTGTGKTAAFVLPILDRLCQEKPSSKRAVKVLVLTPTRELAVQIVEFVKGYGRFVGVRATAVYGGVKISHQLSVLQKGVDIVVATPGRLIDHLQRGSVDLRQVRTLVLDEADRMLDMGFIHDVRKIIAEVPDERQTMLFSATMSKEVQTLAAGIMHEPEFVQVGRQHNPADTITQYLYSVSKERKMDLLLHLLKERSMYSVLIFSRTKHGADKISRKLKQAEITSAAIHSNRSQNQRQQALDGFREGRFQVLVATDIAARGINVTGISHVVNFDTPVYCEDYVHRIGRTGRAGAVGDAITFVSADEMEYLRKIEKFIGCKLELETVKGFAAPSVKPAVVEAAASGRTGEGKRKKKSSGWKKKAKFKRPARAAVAC